MQVRAHESAFPEADLDRTGCPPSPPGTHTARPSHICHAGSRGRARIGHSSLPATPVYIWKGKKMEHSWTINKPLTVQCMSVCLGFFLSGFSELVNFLKCKNEGPQKSVLLSEFSRNNVSKWARIVSLKLGDVFGCIAIPFLKPNQSMDKRCVIPQGTGDHHLAKGIRDGLGTCTCQASHKTHFLCCTRRCIPNLWDRKKATRARLPPEHIKKKREANLFETFEAMKYWYVILFIFLFFFFLHTQGVREERLVEVKSLCLTTPEDWWNDRITFDDACRDQN